MRLVEPTDFDVLGVLEGGRNVAPNIAVELGRDRPYINTRLPHLHDQELLTGLAPLTIPGCMR